MLMSQVLVGNKFFSRPTFCLRLSVRAYKEPTAVHWSSHVRASPWRRSGASRRSIKHGKYTTYNSLGSRSWESEKSDKLRRRVALCVKRSGDTFIESTPAAKTSPKHTKGYWNKSLSHTCYGRHKLRMRAQILQRQLQSVRLRGRQPYNSS